MRFVLLVAALLGTACACSSTSDGSGLPSWQEDARAAELSHAEIGALEKNGLLVTDKAFKQIFQPYLITEAPLFITSDSLINAYHVLFEESVLRLEAARAEQMPAFLTRLYVGLGPAADAIEGEPELVAAAEARARLVVGIALAQFDDSFQFGDPALDAILTRERARIASATWAGLPAWLGEPCPSLLALDYSRYAPRGFYTRTEMLKRSFRAVSWLQSIPFRPERDEELLAVSLLASSLCGGAEDSGCPEAAFVEAYTEFIGAPDDWGLREAADLLRPRIVLDESGEISAEIRAELAARVRRSAPVSRINDQLRLPPRGTELPAFRILPAYRTPSALLFAETTRLPDAPRPLPDGLEVAAALGSAFARDRLQREEEPSLLAAIDAAEPEFVGTNLYRSYLAALRALVDEPESAAPAFMKSKPWQVKSCNTVLAGWAQLRHTWTLEAKPSEYYLGATSPPAGFVEPEPLFFERMASLAGDSRTLLEQAGAFKLREAELAAGLRRLAAFLEKMDDAGDQIILFDHEFYTACHLSLALSVAEERIEQAREEGRPYREVADWARSLADGLAAGHDGETAELRALLEEHRCGLAGDWEALAALSRQLETIAHKQLRGEALSGSDEETFREYGKRLAGIMQYGGNAYLTPLDDAPRVTEVFSNAQAGERLHVGVARARELYVLYPWQGSTVLCRGAVMPYYEFAEPRRLDDAGWRERLDSEDRPELPSWMVPIVDRKGRGRPSFAWWP